MHNVLAIGSRIVHSSMSDCLIWYI